MDMEKMSDLEAVEELTKEESDFDVAAKGTTERTSRDILVALALKYKGNWEQIYKGISLREDIEDEYIEKAKEIKNAITLTDEGYPEYAKRMMQPPFVLFYKGNKELLNEVETVAILGAENLTGFSEEEKNKELETAVKVVYDINKRGMIIVSHLESGICESVLRAAVCLEPDRIIAVLDRGIDNQFDKEDDLKELATEIELKGGLLVSEIPTEEPRRGIVCERATKLIEFISKMTIMTLVREESKSLTKSLIIGELLMSVGLEDNVFVVPKDILSSALSIKTDKILNNKLINDKIVRPYLGEVTADSIEGEIEIKFKKKKEGR